MIPILCKARTRECHTEINGPECMREEGVRDGKVSGVTRKLQCQSTVECRTNITLGMGTAHRKPIILASLAALCRKIYKCYAVNIPRLKKGK